MTTGATNKLQERLDALADATYAYEGGERECAAFKLGAKNALVHLDAAEAEIARLKEQLDGAKDDVLRLHKEKCDLLYPETAAQPPAVGEDVVGLAWRPIQDHVFPWEPHELIVACFYIGPESELKPEVQIFEAYCSKGNYFERSAGRSTGMTTLLEEGWTPFAWLDHATPPAIPSEDEMRAAKEHFRDYLGGEHDTGRANLLRTKDAG